jgi:DNA-directed RNA polymerase specialized sigma24 family protein
MVRIAVSSLEEIYREAFVLLWFGGLTHKEIGEIQGVSTANAKMRCHRAMNEVVKILKPYYINTGY